MWGDGYAYAVSGKNRVLESKSVQELLVCNSPHIIFRAGVNHFDMFITQTSRKVRAIIKIHFSKFDGNRLQTERQESRGKKRKKLRS